MSLSRISAPSVFHAAPFFIAALFAVVVAGSCFAQPARSGNAAQQTAFRDGIVLVGFQESATLQQQAEVIAAAGAVKLRVIGKGANVLKVPPGQVMRVVEALQHSPVVRYAEPDYREFLSGAPNDPNFPQQWAFHNTGQTVDGVTGTSGADEGTLRAWNVTQGTSSVVVAVVDTGIDYTHPDLAANIWSNPGGINGCAAGTHGYNVLTNVCDPMDDDTVYDGHGTHVAGIIGAVTNNGVGVAGVNWQTSLLGVKWVDANGNGFTSDLITALDWVVQAKQAGVNIKVVNDSQTWAGTPASQALSDQIDVLGANDMLFVTAAGNTAQNNDTTPRYPCVYDRPNQLCVAASDQNDKLWSSSDFGLQTVDMAAPGVNILSTLRNGAYGFISGCSMSAAQVSGAAALVLATGYQSVSTLRSTLLNAVDPLPAFAATTRTGGRLDICKAVPGCESASSVNLVQQASVQGRTTSSVSASFAGSNTAGDLIIAAVRASTTTQTVSVADRLGNKYTDAVQQAQAADGSQIHIFYAPNIIGGANMVTATFSGNNNHPWLAVFEYSGLSATLPLDRTASAQGTSLSASSGSTAQTRAANELVFGVLGLPSSSSASVTAGSGFVIEQQATTSGGSRAATEDQTASAQASFSANFAVSASVNWSAAVATFSTTPISNSAALTITTTSLPNATVGTAYSATLSASGGTPPYTWTVSGSLPAGLSLSSSGTISGTPTTAGTSNFTVQVKDSASATASAGLSITVNPASAPLTITTTSLPNGTVGTAYSSTLSASGGTSPYTWTVSGSLPAGLSLSSSGTISGTPTTAGTSSFTVQVKDSASATASAGLSITVNSSTGTPITQVQTNAGFSSGVASISQSFPGATTQGNMILAFVRMSTTSQTVSVSDSAGNSFTDAVSQAQSADGSQTHIFYARNIKGGADTVTATFSSTNNHPWLAIYEFSGLNATAPLDRVAAAQGSSSTPSSGSTAATSSANELVFTGLGLPASSSVTVTGASGFTLLQQDTAANTSRAAEEDQIVNAVGQYAGNFTISSAANWSVVLATFKQ